VKISCNLQFVVFLFSSSGFSRLSLKNFQTCTQLSSFSSPLSFFLFFILTFDFSLPFSLLCGFSLPYPFFIPSLSPHPFIPSLCFLSLFFSFRGISFPFCVPLSHERSLEFQRALGLFFGVEGLADLYFR